MLNLGASINVMPMSIFRPLRLGLLKPTGVVIQLANKNNDHPTTVIEDVLVRVQELIFPIDFYILEMEVKTSSSAASLILGRPILKTARTKIDVHVGTLSIKFGDSIVPFNILNALKHPMKEHSMFHIDIIDDLVEEVHSSLNEEFPKLCGMDDSMDYFFCNQCNGFELCS